MYQLYAKSNTHSHLPFLEGPSPLKMKVCNLFQAGGDVKHQIQTFCMRASSGATLGIAKLSPGSSSTELALILINPAARPPNARPPGLVVK